MGLFNRKPTSDDTSEETKKEKGGWKRPANTAFKQQRLKAWQPILTPKTVLPTLFIIGILFGPIGGLLIWGSSLVSEITLEYTQCENLPASTSRTDLNLQPMPSFQYRLRAGDDKLPHNAPQYAFVRDEANTDPAKQSQCVIQFHVPADLKASVFMYYKLTNFYQNHRRYVKSIVSDQLKGDAVDTATMKGGDCAPLDLDPNGKIIFPCGLIANSVFNDSFSDLELLNEAVGTGTTYAMSNKGIAWPGESRKYAETKYDISEIVPPPNWGKRYPNGYTTENPPPNLKDDEHFHNWMRTAGLPTFTKLYKRNDVDTLPKGTYQIVVDLNFPVLSYKGTKSIVISTVSWIGGKNPFLGYAYVVAAGLFILLALAGTARHLIKPRRLGDMSLLSWNR